MFINYDNRVLDNIIQRLYSASYSTLSNASSLENTLGIYRPDALRAIQRGQTQKGAVKATLAVVWAVKHREAGGYTHIGMAKRNNMPDDAVIAGTFKDTNSTEWVIYGTNNARSTMTRAVISVHDLDFTATFAEQSVTADPGAELTFETQDNIVLIRPSVERLAALPAGARPFALRIGTLENTGNNIRKAWNITHVPDSETWVMTEATPVAEATPTPNVSGGLPTADVLITEARTAYREWLRVTMGRPAYDAAEVAKREAARKASADRFAAFARRTPDTDKHVATLPFVPHGLASSRRWGIEVESGGARGIEAPKHWKRIGDGSLRSAWDGYKEVQDFEPFDEEVERWRPTAECRNDHRIELNSYNYTTGRDDWRANPAYINPADCNECGGIVETVHRTPQTIVHQAQNDDCAEFVSPILVSMHSKGLEAILTELAKQPQNDTSGVHVHVEADDLSPEQVAALVFGYDILEPILEASYQRQSRQYCKRREPQTVLEFARKLRHGAPKLTDNDVRRGERYVTLNTNALSQHGTIEFRAMGPVYDYEYLTRWAMLCRELVNMAKAGVTVKQFSRVKSWKDLTMLLAEYGKEYVRASIFEATGETGSAAALVKAGAEVTTEALNTDYQTVVSAFAELSAAADEARRSLFDGIRQFTTHNRPVADLVTAGNSTNSNRWGV